MPSLCVEIAHRTHQYTFQSVFKTARSEATPEKCTAANALDAGQGIVGHVQHLQQPAAFQPCTAKMPPSSKQHWQLPKVSLADRHHVHHPEKSEHEQPVSIQGNCRRTAPEMLVRLLDCACSSTRAVRGARAEPKLLSRSRPRLSCVTWLHSLPCVALASWLPVRIAPAAKLHHS